MAEEAAPVSSTRAMLRQRDFLVYLASRGCGVLGTEGQSVTMGWQVYDLARASRGVAESSLYVGLLGLSIFLPLFALALPAGLVADRYSRRRTLMLCYMAEIVCAVGLVVLSATGHLTEVSLIAIAFGFGVARAFRAPAGVAMAPMLVPRTLLPRAIAWNALTFQVGSISGPALAGVLVGRWNSTVAYAVCVGLYVVAVFGLGMIHRNTTPALQPGSKIGQVREGLAWIWHNKVVLGAISLDLFAVLLGGATALLPVFARDILGVGAQGFGVLRAAPAVGAASVALVLAARPIHRKAGPAMFTGVAIFGVMTVIFGISRSFWVSLVALAILGGADMVSVYVRQTLMQVVTPDAMRGRVAAVSFLFIGASNELGEFESGVTARLLGPVTATIAGGVASLAVTGTWAWLFPELRRVDRLESAP